MTTTLHLTLDEYDTMLKVGAFDRIERKIELIHGELVNRAQMTMTNDSSAPSPTCYHR